MTKCRDQVYRRLESNTVYSNGGSHVWGPPDVRKRVVNGLIREIGRVQRYANTCIELATWVQVQDSKLVITKVVIQRLTVGSDDSSNGVHVVNCSNQ